MLEGAVAELRGEPISEDVEPDLTFDVEAALPESYIPEVGVRLSFYKRLASVRDPEEVMDIARELEDRFGNPPALAHQFFELMRVKAVLRKLCVLACEATARVVTLHFREDTPLDHAGLIERVQAEPDTYKLSPDMRLTRRVKSSEAPRSSLEFASLVLAELMTLVRPQPTRKHQ
jgi:transcription-repair coupling factor (superfamily II helicase)